LLKALASCDLCASTETLDELEQVLDRDKFDRYLDRELRRSFVALMRRHMHLFAVQDADREAVEPPCRDPKDKSISGPGRRSRCSRCTCQQR
jgi:predicted nucleic acid-binding protein